MNSPSEVTQAAKESVQKLAAKVQEYAHRDPVQATAIALGIALGWHLIPTKVLFRTVAFSTAALAKPTLLVLGAMKAIEVYNTSQAAKRPSSKWHATANEQVIVP